ncbi:MAG: serine/threonine protein kinase, partial [Gemmataceae bacterium]|nr:serine/threonine protein kinase [Gemmataceae bacterium]
MAALPRLTCAVCGAPLTGPVDGLGSSARCPSCDTAIGPGSEVEEQGRQSLRFSDQVESKTRPLSPRPLDRHDTAAAQPLASGDSDRQNQLSQHTDDADARGAANTTDASQTVDFTPCKGQNDAGAGPADELALPGQNRFGRFQVLSVLGRGGFGTVYRAYDPLLDREVALKVPRFVDDDPALLARFVGEAKAAARLRHPNIVAIYESGQAGAAPYIASEFVDGVPLNRLLRERRLDARTAVDWVRQIAEALHYAHQEGIIHRDIKPANIMVTHAGRPQVMDFGLAKRAADEAARMTTEGQIIGTPAYMAPEQARGHSADVGPRSDEYSVGVLLYEMLCGQTPFLGDAWSVMSQVSDVHAAPPPPRSVR